MLKKITLTILLMTCGFFLQTSAQTAPDVEKQAAIKELIALMESGIKASDIINMIDAQTNESAKAIFNHTLAENKEWSAEDKKIFEDLFFKDRNNIQKRYQEKFLSKIDIDALVNELVNSVYDKHFTLAEIKDLIVFYKSPTGQRMIKLTPVLVQDTMRVMSEKLVPKIMDVGKEIEAEMKREVELKVKEQTSKKRKIKSQ